MFDFIYKFLRHYLSIILVLDERAYEFCRHSVGRVGSCLNFESFRKVVNRYIQEVSVENKTILEVGPGNQLVTAILLLLNGAERVFLIETNFHLDKALQFTKKIFADKIGEEKLKSYLKKITPLRYKIDRPFDIEVLDMLVKKIDIVVSHAVLEHVNDLDTAFKNFSLILKKHGDMFHLVDLSDHTYHIFERYAFINLNILGRQALNHLRYSNHLFRLLDDSKICPMNRELLPTYIRLCSKYNIEIRRLNTTPFVRKAIIHNDILEKIDHASRTPQFINIRGFDLAAKHI